MSGVYALPWRRGPEQSVLDWSDRSPSGYFVVYGWSLADESAWRVDDFDRRTLDWMLARTTIALLVASDAAVDWPPISLRVQPHLQAFGRVLLALIEPVVADEWADFIAPRLPIASDLHLLLPPAPGRPLRSH